MKMNLKAEAARPAGNNESCSERELYSCKCLHEKNTHLNSTDVLYFDILEKQEQAESRIGRQKEVISVQALMK